MRQHLRKEIHEAKYTLNKGSDILRDDVREQIRMLEETRAERPLTMEEEKIVKRLKRDLDGVERVDRREMQEIREISR
jgi:hypothetical protein